MKQSRSYSLFALTVFLLFVLVPCAFAGNTYKPHLHKPAIPDSPALSLLGSYQTELWPGAATYNYPINVPPGRNGIQPILSINYNSHLTSQRPSIVGTGWTLTENYISREVNNSFEDASDDKFWLVFNDQVYELVYVSSESRFYTKIESYLYIANASNGNNSNDQYWIVKTKDGTNYRFGYNNDSELVSNIHDYVTKWSLDLINDTHDNQIYYSYNESPTANDIGAVYPYKIEYNNEKSRVIEFDLEDSDRPDSWLVYEQGNKIREARRIKEIQIKADGQLVRKYVINYTVIDSPSRSFLSLITLYGSDGTTGLPSTTFEYYNNTKGWREDETYRIPYWATFESIGSDYGVRLLDLNRDGLLDIVKAEEVNPHLNYSWINNGTGWDENHSWDPPYWITADAPTSYNDMGMRFIDFDGDGFTDVVRGDGATRKSWQNSGDGWLSDDSSWYLPTNANPVDTGSEIYERGVRFTDFNGDGLIDILSATDDWNYAWINNGSGWDLDSSWNVPSDARFVIYPSGKDEGVRLADINGDGLPDLVKGEDNDRRTWLNNGTNWVEDSSWVIPLEANFTVSGTGEDMGVRLADINSDGLTDLIKGYKGETNTWINNGSGWVEDSSWDVPRNANFVNVAGDNDGIRLVDVNGDSSVDVINGGDRDRTFLNKAVKNHLLKNINNTLGGSSTIKYIESTELNNTGSDNYSDLGFNLWLVETVTEENGMNGSQSLDLDVDYNYRNGYYDYVDREFRGFGEVEEIKPEAMIKHLFNQSDSLKGREYETEFFDLNSSSFKKISFNWTSTEQDGYHTNQLSSVITYFYDGFNTNFKITGEVYEYDDYGNVVSFSNLGENATSGDETYEYWQFVYNTTQWVVNRAKNYSLFDYDNSTKIKETVYRYDNLSYGVEPTKGDLTWEENWLDTGDNPIIKYDYDSYGNLIETTDPRGFVIEYKFGITDSTSTFVDQIINAKGHSFDYTYDLGTGNLFSETDGAGNVINYTYDVFGRIKKEILPYDSVTYPTKEYSYSLDGDAPEKIEVTQRENSGQAGTFDTYYFYDGLGNLIQIKSEAEDTQQTVTDFYYDDTKRINKQSNPYLISNSSNYSSPNQSVNYTSYTYDALSRITLVSNPDDTQRNITYEPWKVISYDEKGAKKIGSFDAYGQIIEVVEYVGDNYYRTRYDYNPAGR